MAQFSAFIKNLLSKLTRITKSGSYIPEIDGLRFLAILPVIIQHLSERLLNYYPGDSSQILEASSLVYYSSRGTIGVFIFFALSGFILSLPIANQLINGRLDFDLKKYYIRRFTRIEPPYIFWMSVFLIVLLIQGNTMPGELLKGWLASLFYMHNIIYQDYSIINPIAWSLEIEIQFYILAPFLAMLFFSIKKKVNRRLILLLSILGLISIQSYFGWVHLPFKLTLLGQAHHFLIGFLVADLYISGDLSKGKSHWYDWFGIVSFYIMMISWSEEYIKTIIFSSALFVLFISAYKGLLLNLLFRNKWIIAIGGMCYTIYLIHLPLLEFQFKLTKSFIVFESFGLNFLLQMMIALPLILIVTILSYLLIEKPFMNPNWASNFKDIRQSLNIHKIWQVK